MRDWELSVRSSRHDEMVNITAHVQELLRGQPDGVVTVFVQHTSAGVTINENADPDVQSDMLAWLTKLVPNDPSFEHAEGNSDAHIKATLVGSSAQVPFVGGRLLLGVWQGIYLCEFDGPRERRVIVSLTTG
ncbi:MAG: secondary thiamine-phosphate synthase enzyme YjbQ [Tepidiformaceae bacterium]